MNQKREMEQQFNRDKKKIQNYSVKTFGIQKNNYPICNVESSLNKSPYFCQVIKKKALLDMVCYCLMKHPEPNNTITASVKAYYQFFEQNKLPKKILQPKNTYQTANNIYLLFDCPINEPILFLTKQQNLRHLLDIADILFDLSDMNQGLAILSPKHIYFADGEVRVHGVGLYRLENEIFGRKKRLEEIGTRMYLAPELLGYQDPENMPKCDVWSLGVLASVMLHRQYPFEDPFLSLQKQGGEYVIGSEGLEYVFKPCIFDLAKQQSENQLERELNWCIRKMLVVNPEERMDIKDVYQFLKNHLQNLQ